MRYTMAINVGWYHIDTMVPGSTYCLYYLVVWCLYFSCLYVLVCEMFLVYLFYVEYQPLAADLLPNNGKCTVQI